MIEFRSLAGWCGVSTGSVTRSDYGYGYVGVGQEGVWEFSCLLFL